MSVVSAAPPSAPAAGATPAVVTSAVVTSGGTLATRFCGLGLASPIVLLSGCVGFGEEYTRVAGFSNREVGAIVLKGTTGKPRLGNPPHRVAETYLGLLNAIGPQNSAGDVAGRSNHPGAPF